MDVGEGSEAFTVSETVCLGCGACSSLAPQIFVLRGGTIAIARQPASPIERTLARAALINCPSSAIGVRTAAA